MIKSKRFYMMTLTFVTGTLVALAFMVTPSFAQNNEEVTNTSGLTISPVAFELNADPGDVVINKLKVYNPTDNTQSVVMVLKDFSPVDEEGNVATTLPGDNDTYSIAKWTVITPAKFQLEPGAEQIVAFSVDVPENAEPGYHGGTVLASVSGGAQEVTGSAIGNERGPLVLMTVSGDVDEQLLVDTFATDSFREYGPIDFDLKFENVGNVHVKPEGFITITNFAGDEVKQLEIPANNVIPGAIRKADVKWDEENLIGRYTATVVANYGSGSQEVVTDSITFTVFPWKIAAGIAIVLIAILVILFLMRGRIKKASKALAGKE